MSVTGLFNMALSMSAKPSLESATRFTIAQQLLDHIFAAGLPDGRLLPPERELAKQLHVSRAMLREALRILEMQGLITVRPGRGGGIVVHRPTAEAVARDLALIVRWEHTGVKEIVAARALIERGCVRELCRSCPPARLERLRRAASRRGAHGGDFLAYNRFHHLLVAMANNRVITQLYRGLIRALYLHVRPTLTLRSEHHELSVRAHIAIVDAIAARDVDLAERLLDEHIASHIVYIEPAPAATLN
jgi:GntR family transcriptional repressor for pyruvate dehydrogenase complex